jgi:hypothetical protein
MLLYRQASRLFVIESFVALGIFLGRGGIRHRNVFQSVEVEVEGGMALERVPLVVDMQDARRSLYELHKGKTVDVHRRTESEDLGEIVGGEETQNILVIQNGASRYEWDISHRFRMQDVSLQNNLESVEFLICGFHI